jgi:hypothetical protein
MLIGRHPDEEIVVAMLGESQPDPSRKEYPGRSLNHLWFAIDHTSFSCSLPQALVTGELISNDPRLDMQPAGGWLSRPNPGPRIAAVGTSPAELGASLSPSGRVDWTEKHPVCATGRPYCHTVRWRADVHFEHRISTLP